MQTIKNKLTVVISFFNTVFQLCFLFQLMFLAINEDGYQLININNINIKLKWQLLCIGAILLVLR